MKATVPEKLYCCNKGNGNIFVDYRPFPNDDNIEYTRTDALVDKACEYLMEYEFNDSPTIADRRKRVDEFRKYMKGG